MRKAVSGIRMRTVSAGDTKPSGDWAPGRDREVTEMPERAGGITTADPRIRRRGQSAGGGCAMRLWRVGWSGWIRRVQQLAHRASGFLCCRPDTVETRTQQDVGSPPASVGEPRFVEDE